MIEKNHNRRESVNYLETAPWRPVTKLFAMVAVLVVATGADLAANDFLVSSRFSNSVLRYDSSGAFVEVFASGAELANPNGIAFGPDGHLYVGLGDLSKVLKYNGGTGAFIGEFVSAGSGGLSGVRDLLFGPDGDLYVASGTSDQVLRYDGTSGAFVGVAASGNGLNGPVGLVFDSDGTLFIAAALSNLVYVFDNGVFVQSFNAGITHSNSVGLAFNSAGQLLVSQSVTNEVLAFDPDTGTFQGVFINGPAGTPIYMQRSPDGGQLLVGAFSTDSVWRYNADTGALIDQIVAPGSGGLDGTHDIAFFPPVAVEPDGFATTIGSLNSGGLSELIDSDDQYLVLDPTFTVSRYQLEMTVDATSVTDSPCGLAFTLEAKMFTTVGTVQQKIELFNYVTAAYETLDTRLATTTDSAVTVLPSGDPTRFVETGTGAMRARVVYQNSLPFWVTRLVNLYLPFRTRVDQIVWTITP